jgi:hypothetical protein
MPTAEELERLSSQELHDQAMDLAKSRGDVRWLWRLMKSIPAAEAAMGDVDEASMDVVSTVHAIHDFVHDDEGKLADALRPMYIEYLAEHGN